MQNLALKIVAMVIGVLLPQVTPLIKEELARFLRFVYSKAKETPNPIDDALAGILLELFKIETPALTDVPPLVISEQTGHFEGLPNLATQ